MKKISVVVPCYNEEENVVPISEAIIDELEKLTSYDYELLFIDNYSTDRTRALLTGLCCDHKKIKAIFNTKNFGQFSSPVYGMMQATGDCVILICADFQDPVEMIAKFVEEWENGYQIVCGIKKTSKENKVMRFLRTCYYKLIKKMSEVDQIEHFTGFGLYDKSFIQVLRDLKDPKPFLRGLVAELGPTRKEIPYEQARRRAGKTHNNFFTLYDGAMLSFTSYTKIGLRIATFIGFFIGGISLLIGIAYLIMKLVFWNSFQMGLAPVTIGIFFLGAVQLFFIGLIGEYIISMNTRIMNRPLVIEEKRINFEEEGKYDN